MSWRGARAAVLGAACGLGVASCGDFETALAGYCGRFPARCDGGLADSGSVRSDSGEDGGADAGGDAGAGVPDGGDGGAPDAGTSDGGMDAGEPDAGAPCVTSGPCSSATDCCAGFGCSASSGGQCQQAFGTGRFPDGWLCGSHDQCSYGFCQGGVCNAILSCRGVRQSCDPVPCCDSPTRLSCDGTLCKLLSGEPCLDASACASGACAQGLCSP